MSRSEVFTYHDEEGAPLCPTLLSDLDRHAREVGGSIGFDPEPGDPPIVYYKFRDETAFAAAGVCADDAGGCAGPDALFASQAFHAHEQAHTYTFRAFGYPSVSLLNEGEAVAMSCSPSAFIAPTQRPAEVVQSVAWRDVLHLDADAFDGYIAAGYFVTYLAERYGWSRVAELHRRVPFDVAAADFEQAFAEVYPIAMDQAWSEALGTPGAQPCFKDWLCRATPLVAGEDTPPACDGQMHRSVTVTDQAGVGLALHGIRGEITLLQGCADPAPPWIALMSDTTHATHWLNLAPGTYTLADMYQVGSPEGVVLQGYLPKGFLGDTCETAGTLLFDAEGETYLDLLDGPVNGWVGLSGGAGRSFLAFQFGIALDQTDSPGTVEVCDGCGASGSCVAIPLGSLGSITAKMVTVGDHAVLHFRDARATHVAPVVSQPYLAFLPLGGTP